MATTKLFLFVSSCLLCLRTACCQQDQSETWNSDKYKEEAAQTFNLVFHKYNPRVRPPHERIEVTTIISLRHIRHLDLRKQELQTVLDVEMNWNDSRLQWYPVRVQQISANTSTVWTPDIVFTNSVAETKVLYPSAVKINHKGFVAWTRKEVVTTFCATQPGTLTQNCSITLGFMSNHRNDQTDRFFSSFSSFVRPEDFTNHEWNLVETVLYLDIENGTGRAYSIELNLVLERRSKVMEGHLDLQPNGIPKISHNDCGDRDEVTNDKGSAPVMLQVSVEPLLWLVVTVVSHLCRRLLLR